MDLFLDSRSKSDIYAIKTVSLDGSFIPTTVMGTATSDVDGIFDFGRVNGGTYILTVVPPADYINVFPTQSMVINISSDLNIDILLGIIWGNTSIDYTYNATFL